MIQRFLATKLYQDDFLSSFVKNVTEYSTVIVD